MKCQARSSQHPSQNPHLRAPGAQSPHQKSKHAKLWGDGSPGMRLSTARTLWTGQDGSILQITGLSPSNRQHIVFHVTCKGPKTQRTRKGKGAPSILVTPSSRGCSRGCFSRGRAWVLPATTTRPKRAPHLLYPAPRG